MASTGVLKFPRSDNDSASVLLQVTSAGRKSLDLKLLATEGDAPYVCVLQHDRVASLRAKNCPVTEKEWEHILDSLLHQATMEGIQATAAVQSESSISLTVRKQVQGITQRLGSVTLTCNQDEQIELFRWCEICLDASAKREQEIASSAAKVRELQTAVTGLQAQLDELVQAKQDDESALLHKFRDLLNEKKVRIREQEKIIAASSFGRERSASSQPPQTADAPQIARRPAKSRPSKRKAASTNVEEEVRGGGDQAMEDDTVKAEPEDTDPGDTSDDTGSVMDDDDDDDDGDDDAAGKKVAHDSDQAGSAHDIGRSKRQRTPPNKATRKPPPPRKLPFGDGKAVASALSEGGTESDDEL